MAAVFSPVPQLDGSFSGLADASCRVRVAGGLEPRFRKRHFQWGPPRADDCDDFEQSNLHLLLAGICRAWGERADSGNF